MAEPRYITIPNWDRFQHYKDRTPLWIKNYTELLSDPAYVGLTAPQRGVLHGLWLMYAKGRRNVLGSTLYVSRQLGVRVTEQTLNALNHAGFIEFSASRPLAPRYQAASPEYIDLKAGEDLEFNSAAADTTLGDDPSPAAAADLHTHLDTLQVNGPLRGAALAEPDRANACALAALSRGTKNPGGLFRTMFESGEWPKGHQPQKNPPYAVAKAWVIKTGWRFPDEDLHEELGRRFGMEGEQKTRLAEIAYDLQAKVAS